MPWRALRTSTRPYSTLEVFGETQNISRLVSKSAKIMSSPQASSSKTAMPAPRYQVVPAPRHPGMTVLDRDAFNIKLTVLGVKVEGTKLGSLKTQLTKAGQLLALEKVKSVEEYHGDDGFKGKVLLLKARNESELSPETSNLLQDIGNGLVSRTVTLNYDHWAVSDIMEAVLPDELAGESPSSFTATGHIAHVNLRDEYLPYKNLIGQLILDKNKNIRTVVNKLNTIHAQFRFFDMEVIAGDSDFITEVHEAGCKFTFDFSCVYWNSRLGSEHERLVALFQPGEVVADVMAGVGPFAVPAAKKGCYVLGNDLNPESAKWMEKNRVENKVEDALRVSCTDGRAFISAAPVQAWQTPFEPLKPRVSRSKADKLARKARHAGAGTAAPVPDETPASTEPTSIAPQLVQHYVMNLPDSALEFLDAYQGCYRGLLSFEDFRAAYGQNGENVPMPLIHVHCFTRELEYVDAERDICERATSTLGHMVKNDMEGFYLHSVRRVAPNKDMYCLSFRLPRSVAFS